MKLGVSTACTFAIISFFLSRHPANADGVSLHVDDVSESANWGLPDNSVDGEGGASGCDSPDDDCGLGNLAGCPRWTVTADALFLTRRVVSKPLITDIKTGTESLSTAALDLSCHAGFEASLSRHFDNGNTLEIRYAGVDQWSAQSMIATAPGDILRINAAVPAFTVAGTAIDANYASQWHSVELNARHEFCCLPRLSVLAGFRYAEVDERWGFGLVGTAPPLNLDTTTRNRLYGFQLGGQAVLWDRGGPLSIEGLGKAGIYGNHAAQDSRYTSSDGSVLPAGDTATSTAFLGELGLTGKYQITDRFSLRGGYRLLWIDGLALAPAQLAATNFVFGHGIDASGEAFFHGAFVGLEYAR